MTLEELETEAIELIKSLDCLGDGAGPKAFGMYQQALLRLRPFLLEQRKPLAEYLAKLDALMAGGMTLGEAAMALSREGAECDATVLSFEANLRGTWERLVADLNELGRQSLAEEAS